MWLKKLSELIVFVFCLFVFPSIVNAQATPGYVVREFSSDIKIEKNTVIDVTEIIDVYFYTQKHGIFRIIPYIYTVKGKTEKTKLEILSVTDSEGNPYNYEVENYVQSKRIKIGDAEKYVSGEKLYVIHYEVAGVVRQYEDYDELYWNVTGGEWDTQIETATASISSPYAEIIDIDCFSGSVGGEGKNCRAQGGGNESFYTSTKALGIGKDFTIIAALSKDNELIFPGLWDKFLSAITDNWPYFAALLPLSFLFTFWYKRGRDKRYLSDNVYYEQEGDKVVDRSIFAREHLPTVYSPIKGITPSEAGTIIDEKVDIEDIVGELLELARLGHIKIEKVEKDKLIGKKADYAFYRLAGGRKLENYQNYLLDKIFTKERCLKSIEIAGDYFKKNKLDKISKQATEKKFVLLSSFKKVFYQNLDSFKDKLYENLDNSGLFIGRPDKVRREWFVKALVMWGLTYFLVQGSIVASQNFWPLIVLFVTILPGLLLVKSMPRKSALGYSFSRQIKGLRYYLEKGKWRYEIQEKHLFIEEILPLAVALGVADRLTKDMKDLDVKPPRYFTGTTIGAFSNDLTNFGNETSNTFLSSPGGKWSGSSSWSGGSGFSGGSVGGGFGGGGGGSW
jgi:hypothetical protein